MNSLSVFTKRYAKAIFASYMSEGQLEKAVKYTFYVNDRALYDLKKGDYIIMETIQGLQIGVFFEFTKIEPDVILRSRKIISRINNLTIYNYKK